MTPRAFKGLVLQNVCEVKKRRGVKKNGGDVRCIYSPILSSKQEMEKEVLWRGRAEQAKLGEVLEGLEVTRINYKVARGLS